MSNNDGKINWSEIRRAIRKAEESTEAAVNPGPEQIEQILMARAGQLAKPAAMPVAEHQVELMLFTAGSAKLAIESSYVRGVARAGRITRLYGGPAHLLGVSSYQGDVIAVVDVGMIPGHTSVQTSSHTSSNTPANAIRQEPVVEEEASLLLVLGDVQVELAFLVTSIMGQVRVPAARINPLSGTSDSDDAAGVMKGIITGLADDDPVSVFDGQALLRHPSLYFDI